MKLRSGQLFGQHAGPGQPLAATAWDPAWAQVEIEHFRTLCDWGCFTQLVAKKLRVSARRALSAHTTTACQPRKVDGPGGSLSSAGMDNILPAVGGNSSSCMSTCPMHFPMGMVSLSHMSAQQKKTPRRFRTRLAWSCCATWTGCNMVASCRAGST